MAQALFQQRLHRETGSTGEGFRVLSAGIFAEDGHPASREAIKVMGEEGIDLSAHGSTRFNKDLAREADIILTMTRNQRDYVRQEYPEKADSTFTLHEFCDDLSGEVLDPYGLGLSEYRSCLAEIKILVDGVFNKIIESRMR